MMGENKVTAVVLAAGKSKRTKTTLPKVLLEVGGRPLIFYILDTLRKVKYIDNIIIVTGHKRELLEEAVKKVYHDIKFSLQRELNGTAKAVESAKELLTDSENVLVICGDTPLVTPSTIKKFIKNFFKENAHCSIITAYFKEKTDLGRIIRDRENNIERIAEKVDLEDEVKMEEVNSGIYCFKKKFLFDGLGEITCHKKKKEYFLTDIVNIFYRRGLKILGFTLDDPNELIGVNTQDNLSLVNRLLNKRFIDNLRAKGAVIIDPDTTFVSYDTKIGRDTVVYPFTFIEKNVIIGRNCKLGPFVHIRKDSVIEDNVCVGNFVEINCSRLGEGVRMKHFSYVGDTTVGKKVNIGAGTVVANYDGYKKNKTFIENEAFIGSDTVIVAPVRIGKRAKTGAGSVVTKDVEPNTVVVGVPAKIFKKIKG
ncbi:MAG: sugar phosphate nucleotidyltransferase [Candidatus Omnitrophica bacterium]|nr:sugar phosphate nucleotidyltransferase [Candidatus Omnitrophota bacterium]